MKKEKQIEALHDYMLRSDNDDGFSTQAEVDGLRSAFQRLRCWVRFSRSAGDIDGQRSTKASITPVTSEHDRQVQDSRTHHRE